MATSVDKIIYFFALLAVFDVQGDENTLRPGFDTEGIVLDITKPQLNAIPVYKESAQLLDELMSISKTILVTQLSETVKELELNTKSVDSLKHVPLRAGQNITHCFNEDVYEKIFTAYKKSRNETESCSQTSWMSIDKNIVAPIKLIKEKISSIVVEIEAHCTTHAETSENTKCTAGKLQDAKNLVTDLLKRSNDLKNQMPDHKKNLSKEMADCAKDLLINLRRELKSAEDTIWACVRSQIKLKP